MQKTFRLLNIAEGDEVVVCANAYIACVMGITMNGATPVFIEPNQYDNINADNLAAYHIYLKAGFQVLKESVDSFGGKEYLMCKENEGNNSYA